MLCKFSPLVYTTHGPDTVFQTENTTPVVFLIFNPLPEMCGPVSGTYLSQIPTPFHLPPHVCRGLNLHQLPSAAKIFVGPQGINAVFGLAQSFGPLASIARDSKKTSHPIELALLDYFPASAFPTRSAGFSETARNQMSEKPDSILALNLERSSTYQRNREQLSSCQK